MSGRPIPVREFVRFAATGEPQRVDPRDLWRDGYDLARWNEFGGSQNTFPVTHVAAGDWQWVAAMARRWRLEGLWGREFGAPGFYFTAPVACLVVALHYARAAGARLLVADLELALRAVWAWEALTAVPWPRTSSRMIFGRSDGPPLVVRGPGDPLYIGPTTATAGDRWNLKGAEGIGTPGGRPVVGGYPDRDPHGPWLAWALDWPTRADRRAKPGKLRRQDAGPHNAVAHVLEVDDYGETTPASGWGLTDELRDALRAVVRGGPPDAAVELLAASPPSPAERRTIRRTERGVEHVVWTGRRNGNKPALSYARVELGGAWTGVRPCHHRGTGANGGLTVEDAGEAGLRMGCADGARATVDRLSGAVAWRLEVLDGRLELHRGGAVVSPPSPRPSPPRPDPPPGPAPPSPPPSPPATAWSVSNAYGRISIAEPEPGRPLVLAGPVPAAALSLKALETTGDGSVLLELVEPAAGAPVRVRGAGRSVRRFLLEARGPGGPVALVVEYRGHDKPLHFIREHHPRR